MKIYTTAVPFGSIPYCLAALGELETFMKASTGIIFMAERTEFISPDYNYNGIVAGNRASVRNPRLSLVPKWRPHKHVTSHVFR